VVLALAGLLAMAAPAAADVVPSVDCVAPAADTVNVYFGYANDGPQQTIEFGNQNQVAPGSGFQGQPTVFNQGKRLPRLLSATARIAVHLVVPASAVVNPDRLVEPSSANSKTTA
jgi:hypothetical protein